MIHARTVLKVLSLLSLLLLCSMGGREEPSPKAEPVSSTRAEAPYRAERVVVLGFDGADARTVGELVEEHPGRYPTFEKLRREGTFGPLGGVTSPESPVAWASVNSGMNPAKTGVPGFIKRDLKEGASSPSPGFGFIRREMLPLESVDHAPIPTWSAAITGAVFGGLALLVVFGLAFLALRKFVIAMALGVLLGGVAGWAGWMLRGYLPESYPHTANVLQVDSFWDHLARAGVPSVILDGAQVFDRPSPDGARVLAGLGLPDARGELGNWFIYTTDPDEFKREGRDTNTSGTVYRVDEYDGVIETKIDGPRNFWREDRIQAELDEVDRQLADPGLDWEKAPDLSNRSQELKSRLKEVGPTSVPMRIELGDGQATVTIGGGAQTVKVGEWSEFYELSFELNWLVKVDALTRVKLVQLEPHLELFVNVLDIDPRNPPFWQPISSPHGFSKELADDCGRLYETYGWPTPTMPFKDREVDPEILLEDVEFTMKWREDITRRMLDKNDWRCLMSVFSTTDRIQHMMYQFYDTEHPQYDAAEANRKVSFFGEEIALGEAIPMIYEQMDRVMGDVLDRLQPGDTMLVCSDHGFQSFRRQVHINNWLAENGYLKVKPGASKRTAKALLFVDWDQTKVYSLGLGFLYVNLKGREPRGIVDPSEKRSLMEEVRTELMAATDPDTGAKICNDVYIVEDRHEGAYITLEADMITGFAPPYRVGWATSSGGLYMVREEESGLDEIGPICSDNTSPWSGGHVSMALPDVAGVFFSNRRVDVPQDGGVKALHIAPTVLSLLGVDVPEAMDLEPLEFR